jgi:hypothetical protein
MVPTHTVVKRARKSLFILRKLKRIGMGPQILKTYTAAPLRASLTGCITTLYSNCKAPESKAL